MTETKTNWPVVWAAVSGGIVAALYIGKVPPALSLMQEELGLSLVEAGYVISLFNFLGASLAMLIGTSVDQVNRKKLIFASFVCLAIGSLVGSYANDLALLLLSRLIEGAGFICIAVTMPAVVVTVSDARDQPMTLGLWSIFTPTGMVLALLAFPLLAAHMDWRTIWQVLAVPPIFVAGAILYLLRKVDLPEKPVGKIGAVILETLSEKGLWFIAAAFGGFALQWITMMVWLPTFLSAEMGYDTKTAALITATVIAVNVPMNVFGGWLIRQGVATYKLVILTTIVMCAAVLGVFVLPLENEMRVACVYAFSMVGGLMPACLFANVPRHAPSKAHMSSASGMLMQGSSIGQFAGPPLVAYAVGLSSAGWTNAAYPMMAGALVMLIAGLYAVKR